MLICMTNRLHRLNLRVDDQTLRWVTETRREFDVPAAEVIRVALLVAGKHPGDMRGLLEPAAEPPVERLAGRLTTPRAEKPTEMPPGDDPRAGHEIRPLDGSHRHRFVRSDQPIRTDRGMNVYLKTCECGVTEEGYR